MREFAEYPLCSDDELVQLLADGDTRALETLSERYSRPAYLLALRILGHPGWAEEVVQDVLMRLWGRPWMYDPARGDLNRWLLRVTRNASVAELRSRRGTARERNSGPAALDILTDGEDDPADSAWKSVRADLIRAALSELPLAQRQVVELAYYEGLSQSEIAVRTGQPLGTVKTRIRLALDKLRSALGRTGIIE